MKILRARVLRFFFLLNPLNIFRGWRAVSCSTLEGEVLLIAAERIVMHKSRMIRTDTRIFYQVE
jgi:hypothetical protein